MLSTRQCIEACSYVQIFLLNPRNIETILSVGKPWIPLNCMNNILSFVISEERKDFLKCKNCSHGLNYRFRGGVQISGF